MGQRTLERPSPNWKARIEVWREIPTRSASGAIMGILVTACPEPEGIRKLIRVWTISIAMEESHPGRFVKGIESPYTTVSIIWPDWRMTRIPLAIPIMRQATAISLNPLAIFSAMVFGPHPIIKELTTPMIRKVVAISPNPHP